MTIARKTDKHRYWNVRGYWEWHPGQRKWCSICGCDPNGGRKVRAQ
jgi:hypothetical protein